MLSSSYCDMMFFIVVLPRGVFHHFIATLYLCKGDSNRQNRFEQSKISNYDRKISNYGCYYVEELKSWNIPVTILSHL